MTPLLFSDVSQPSTASAICSWAPAGPVNRAASSANAAILMVPSVARLKSARGDTAGFGGAFGSNCPGIARAAGLEARHHGVGQARAAQQHHLVLALGAP